ncbi:MAG: ferric reductase-like transmembrane domain-containing protein [Gloeotrichia echinulata CP02]
MFILHLDTVPFPNLLGFLSLFAYICTLLPSNIRVVFPAIKKSKIIIKLLQYRREIGVLAFLLAVGHGYLLVIKRNFDFFDIKTYGVYIHGSATFIIFTLLAFTSNNWSVKKLKANWRQLHKLTYLAMFLLFWHVHDKMLGHWSWATPLASCGITLVIILFFRRRWLEQKKKDFINHQAFNFVIIGLLFFATTLGLDKVRSLSNAATNDSNQEQQRIRTFHDRAWVYSVAISPDNQTLVSGNYDKSVNIFNLNTGKLIHTLNGHVSAVESVAITSDGNVIASGSWDKKIKLWNLKTGKLIRTLSGHSDDVKAIAFSRDGKTLASASWDKTVKLWDVETGKILRVFQHSDPVRTVAISPDGQMIVSGCEDGKVIIWQMTSGKLNIPLAAHNQAVRSVAFSADGQTLASASNDQTIKLWNLQTGQLLHTLPGHKNAIYSVAFSADGQTLASGSYDQTIKLWNLQNGQLIRTLPGHKNAIYSVAFSADGQTLASGSQDATIKIWRLSKGLGIRD